MNKLWQLYHGPRYTINYLTPPGGATFSYCEELPTKMGIKVSLQENSLLDTKKNYILLNESSNKSAKIRNLWRQSNIVCLTKLFGYHNIVQYYALLKSHTKSYLLYQLNSPIFSSVSISGECLNRLKVSADQRVHCQSINSEKEAYFRCCVSSRK